MNVRDSILHTLREAEEPLTPKDVASLAASKGIADLNYNYVRQLMPKMVEQGLLVKMVDAAGEETGEYELPERVEELPDQDDSGKESAALVERPQEDPSMVYVPLMTVMANGGNGEEPFREEIGGYLCYNRAQIYRETGVNPDRLIAIPISGRSMEPTMRPGDKAIMARYSGEAIADGSIYVFHRHLRGVVIKRAFWKKDGTLLLRSDNRDEPIDWEITPDDEHEWNVIGRVLRVEKAL